MDVVNRNNVVVIGAADAPTVMLAHGFGCDQRMWRFIADELSRSHRVVLFDHVGSGNADVGAWNPLRYSTLDGYAGDVVEIVEALGLGEVVFVGHSVAAMMGVLAVNRRPELFSKLVLVSPSPCYIDDGDYVGGFSRADIDDLLESLDSNYLGWSRAMAPTIMGTDRPELTAELEESFCRTDPACARVFARATFLSDNRRDLSGVRVPTLVIECAEDAIAPRGVGAYVADQVPNSRLVTLDTDGHCPHLSSPDATAAAILSFMGESG